MFMKFKKVYIEITNRCNLNCDFCIKNQRKTQDLSYENYQYIINKISNYTKEIYLHVLGEPLIHKNINDFIDYAYNKGLKVNITTNGYLIKNIANNTLINRLNISLHSFNYKYQLSLNNYLDNIYTTIEKLRKHTFISLRLWVKDKNTPQIIEYLNKKYHQNIEINNNQKVLLANNLIIDYFHEFIWPDLNNNYYSKTGKCYGLINHFGILVDGTIIPCCLDSLGIINLGNIYEDEIDDIFNKKIVKDMQSGFKNNQKCHELCRHCNFLGDKNEIIKLERKNNN